MNVAIFCLLALAWGVDAKDNKKVDICQEPLQTQICRAAIPSWYFDAKDNSCKEFIYGGCPNVNNRFPTKETCIRRCHPEVCELPHQVGPCRANIRSWFYDSESRMCTEFSYGGCSGNDNRFSSQHSCEQACAGTSLPCELSNEFSSVGNKTVNSDYRQRKWLTTNCHARCRMACLGDNPWGECMAFSTHVRRSGCHCYLYDRTLSEEEFDPDSVGRTKNRRCAIDETGQVPPPE